MNENPDFEQDNYSRTAIGIYKEGHDKNGSKKLFAYYGRSYYEKISYYDSMASILISIKKKNIKVNDVNKLTLYKKRCKNE